MARILFVNGSAVGHINPTLPLVREMVERGAEVDYLTTAAFRNRVEEAGAEFLDYGPEMERFNVSFRPTGAHPFFSLMEYLLAQDRAAVPLALERTAGRHYDLVLHDAMLGGGRFVAHRLGLPAVCSCSSFAADRPPVPPPMLQEGYDPQMDGVLRSLAQAHEEWGTDADIADIFFQKEPLNLVYTSRAFQPGGESFDPSYRFVGPLIGRREEHADFLLDRLIGKVLYISLGTINNQALTFYRTCFEAFGGIDLSVVLSVGRHIDLASLGDTPSNFTVHQWVPQLDVLARADAFLSHGGLNSVSEALYYGVPVAAVPMANDQPAVARQLAACGAGLQLKPEEATPQALRAAVDRLLQEGSFRTAARVVGEGFRQAGGFAAAADAVLDYLRVV